MFRNDLLKLSVTLVLLVATAFVSVTAVAADPWYPVKAGDAAVASDWYGRHPSPVKAGDTADLSDYFQRHPSPVKAGDAADLSDYFQRQSSIFSGDVAGSWMYYGPPGR